MLYVRFIVGASISLLSSLLLFYGVAEAAYDNVAESTSRTSQVQAMPDDSIAAAAASNCRYGVSAWESQYLDQLRVGWIQNFAPVGPENMPDDIEFVAAIRVRQDIMSDESGRTVERYSTYTTYPSFPVLARLVAQYPGRVWIAGNEPDREIHQDDTQPYVYAKFYHDVYHFIKGIDPTAQVATAGLVGATPARMQYLDLVWQSYLDQFGTVMPVDVWTFHDYIFAETYADGRWSHAGRALDTDFDLAMLDAEGNADLCSRDDVYCKAEHDSVEIFKEQIIAMRTWMKEHGQQNKPLLLTEFGILYPFQVVDGECTLKDEYGNCFTPQRAAEFMVKTYEHLENAMDPNLGLPRDNNRLVQQWMWFSMPYPLAAAVWNPGLWASIDLRTLTIVGETHINEINKRALNQNLRFDEIEGDFVELSQYGQPATLSAIVYNNGNTAINRPVKVTFYSDPAKTKQIGTATIPAGINGCARRSYVASVTWDAALPPGWHSYWITIDPDGAVNEVSEQDNNGVGKLLVATDLLHYPSVTR